MNLLITCVGRRVFLIKKFKEELNKHNRKLYVTDQDKNAPALYFADGIIEHVNVDLCKEKNITWIMTLHDEQLRYLSEARHMFEEENIKLFLSEFNIIMICRDKSRYDELPINQVPTQIIKNRFGSASQGVEKIRQPFLEGKEYNIQCYFDYYSGKLVDIFMQEKLGMRAGETDKSISTWNDNIYQEIKKLDCNLGFRGAIDIDLILSDKPYIIDINTRFGGGYPLVHECGLNYIEMTCENILGVEINKKIGKPYLLEKIMMKYNGLYFRDKESEKKDA